MRLRLGMALRISARVIVGSHERTSHLIFGQKYSVKQVKFEAQYGIQKVKNGLLPQRGQSGVLMSLVCDASLSSIYSSHLDSASRNSASAFVGSHERTSHSSLEQKYGVKSVVTGGLPQRGQSGVLFSHVMCLPF
jgi:hypothetical protein